MPRTIISDFTVQLNQTHLPYATGVNRKATTKWHSSCAIFCSINNRKWRSRPIYEKRLGSIDVSKNETAVRPQLQESPNCKYSYNNYYSYYNINRSSDSNSIKWAPIQKILQKYYYYILQRRNILYALQFVRISYCGEYYLLIVNWKKTLMMNVSNSSSHSTWLTFKWNAMFLGDENKYNASFFRIEFIPLTSRLPGFVGVVLQDRLENKEALVSWATLAANVNILPDLHVKHFMRPRRTTTYASYSAMISHDSTTISPEMSTIRYRIVAGSPGQGNQKWMMNCSSTIGSQMRERNHAR